MEQHCPGVSINDLEQVNADWETPHKGNTVFQSSIKLANYLLKSKLSL